MTDRRCCYCGAAEDHTLDGRGKFKVELRPYGPGGSDVCHACAHASPERREQTASAFAALLGANEAMSPTRTTMLTPDGPVAVDGARLGDEVAREVQRRNEEGKT